MRKVVIAFFLMIILAGCGENEQTLTRVDIQKLNVEGIVVDVMVTDETSVYNLKAVLEEVRWESGVEAEMVRYEDIRATYFYQLDKNMPERLFHYRIWFNSNETSTWMSNEANQSYGTLDEANTKVLKEELLKER
ncbi:hypothetical protein [Halalkalibacter urbisdiaboli]|uniref:hypothetical protein n=1 Tax=Halalkalibacter urbisdiaboli TaxID=1960589 RepID=UPI000B42D08D|nr:hypothetical protein [Halalkalibacter urbisdiaboli]